MLYQSVIKDKFLCLILIYMAYSTGTMVIFTIKTYFYAFEYDLLKELDVQMFAKHSV